MNAVLYARQSSGDEEQSESIEMQLEKCRELARREDLEVVGEFTDYNTSGRTYPTGGESIAELDRTYQDWFSHQTGSRKYRKGLGDAIEKAVSAKASLVIYDLTRLYRPVSGSYLESYISQRLKGVAILSTKGRIDLDSFGDSLITSITNRINDDQLRLQKEKSVLGLRKLRDAGRFYGTALYGYRYDKNTLTYVGVQDELEAVKEAFRLFLDRLPLAEICRRLDSRRAGKAKLSDFGLRRMLRHPEYCGMTRNSSGELIPLQDGLFDRFPVSPAEWRRVQARLGDRTARPAHPKRYEYAFNGLVRCGYCGKSMTMAISPNTRRGGMATSYKCPGGQGRMNDCQFARIKYSVHDPPTVGGGPVVEAFGHDTLLGHMQRTAAVHPAGEPSSNAVVGLYEAVMPLLAAVCLTTINDEDRTEAVQEKMAALREEVSRTKEAKTRIVGLVADGLVSDEDARGQLERLNGSIRSSEAELAVLEADADSSGKAAVQKCYARLEMIQRGTLPPLDARELFLRRFSSIEVFDTRVVVHCLDGRSFAISKNLSRSVVGMPQYTLAVDKSPDGRFKALVRYYCNSFFLKTGRNDDEHDAFEDEELRVVIVGRVESHSHHKTSDKRKELRRRLSRISKG